ncbi:MAG: hypothetical protein CNLJKLNK_00674 [Holosporales bacterium]
MKSFTILKLFLFIPFLAFSNNASVPMLEKIQKVESIKDYQKTLVLPVNLPMGLSLCINLPKGYKNILNTSTEFFSLFCEFIPENESENNWTNILTVQHIVGKSVTAKTFINQLKNMFASMPGSEIICETIVQGSGHIKGELCIKYTVNGRTEIVYVAVFSGPYDCAIFQNAKVINTHKKEELLKEYKALKKQSEKYAYFADANLVKKN